MLPSCALVWEDPKGELKTMVQDAALHYLDNAATTIPSGKVIGAMTKSLEQDWANPSSLYSPGAAAEKRLAQARGVVAASLGCQPGEVFFTGCGSEGNNLAILGAVRARKGWGNRIIVSGFEHPSVAQPMAQLAREGFDVQVVNPERDGHLDVQKMLDLVDKNTILVACMAVNNETGTIVDIQTLAAGVKEKNSRTAVHVDGVQAWMRIPLNLKNVDSCTVSAHKIHGPKGVGAVYLRQRYHILPPYLGGGQESGIRPGTENLPGIIGMAVAAQEAKKTMTQRHARLTQFNRQLREGLAQIPGITLNSPPDGVAEVVNFSLGDIKSENMLHFLEQRKIYVSSGSACSKGAASHTLAAMGLDEGAIDTAIRVSFCADNTPEDVEALLEGLKEGKETLAKRRS